MSTNRTILPSAVILPDAEETSRSPVASTKRRRASLSDDENKRARIEVGSATVENPHAPRTSPSKTDPKTTSQGLEERKRGKRLFGAVLGALNQSSSSAAQRRRVDIDRKQQEKLKVQTQEYHEQQTKQREQQSAARRQEQAVYVKQAARTQHAHTLAAAHVLHTTVEPRLYYKPRKLLQQQQVRIDRQIAEAQRTPDRSSTTVNDDSPSSIGKADGATDRLKFETRATELPKASAKEEPKADGRSNDTRPSKGGSRAANSPHLSEEGMEDGGDDSVDGDEDDVLY